MQIDDSKQQTTFIINTTKNYCFIATVDGRQASIYCPHFQDPAIISRSNTGETFSSPESDIRRAFLLHKRLYKAL